MPSQRGRGSEHIWDQYELCGSRCLVAIAEALGMVGQNLDDPAVGDLAALALHDHALELPLEGLQARDPRLNKPELRAGYSIGGCAGLRRKIRPARHIRRESAREADEPTL